MAAAAGAQREAYERERARVSEIFEASARGDVQALEASVALADRQGILEFKDANKRTVLHFAASGGHAAACEAILGFVGGASEELKEAVGVQDANGDTPLRLAVRLGRVEAAKVLLDAERRAGTLIGSRADADKACEELETKEALKAKPSLLHEAASSGSVDMVRAALSDFGLAEDINVRAQVGTPIFWAAFLGDAEIARVLLEGGADPNARDSEGLSPLMVAVTRNAADVARELVVAGAELLVCTDQEGDTTVLHAGAAAGADSALASVVAAADADAVRQAAATKASGGLTAVELAAYSGHPRCVGVLAGVSGLGGEEEQRELLERMRGRHDAEEADAAAEADTAAQACNAAKLEGNERFQSGELDEALEAYARGVELAEALLASVEARHARLCSEKSAARVTYAKEEVLAVLLCNRAACYLKSDERDGPDLARADALRAVEMRPKWPKAYYRLGLALSALQQHADAAQAFWTGYELDSKSPGAAALFALFQRSVKAGRDEEESKRAGAPQADGVAAPQPPSGFAHNLPVEVPQDASPSAPMRNLTLSFNDGEAPSMVAARFIQQNALDPSLLPRIAHYLAEYLSEAQ